MVEIIIKKRIVTARIAEKLKNIAVCAPEGSCIPVALENGDFTFDITEDIKTYWDSLNESIRYCDSLHCIALNCQHIIESEHS